MTAAGRYAVWPDRRSRSSDNYVTLICSFMMMMMKVKVTIPSIFKIYLLRHLQRQLANDHWA